MKDLKQYTSIELLNLLNNIKSKHDNLKNEIIDNIDYVDILDRKINNDLELLSVIENEYINIVEEINNR